MTLERSEVKSNRGGPAGADWLWLIFVLGFCHALAIVCTQVLNILVDPIKASLRISDVQYSLLQGVAIAFFAAALGIPVARLADRGNRHKIIIGGVAIWSLASIACGLARSFPELLIARAFVGIGEVVLFPSAFALIADAVPPAQLSRAIGLFGIGGPVGAGIALIGGGWLVSHGNEVGQAIPLLQPYQGWQIAFFSCGILGLMGLGLLATIHEPSKHCAADDHYSLEPLVPVLRKHWRAFLGVSGGVLLLSFAVFATSSWVPTFLVRARAFTYEGAGLLTGVAALVFAGLGALFAGILIDMADRRGRTDGAVTVSIAIAAVFAVLIWLMYLEATPWIAALLLCGAYALMGAPTVLGGTALQQIASPAIRAQVVAIYMLLLNIFAAGPAPSSVAYLTIHVFHNPGSVGLSIVIVDSVSACLAIVLLVWARQPFASRQRQLALDNAGGALHSSPEPYGGPEPVLIVER